MQPEAERTLTIDPMEVSASPTHGPSADFIYAISEFLDTDPKDLLVELGYYGSDSNPAQSSAK